MADTIDVTPVTGSGEPNPDRSNGHDEAAAPLTMERMSAELDGLRSEVERLRDLASGRGRRRNRRTRAEETVVDRAVSRRRLFGLLGGAAAAGAGMAVAGTALSATPAGADGPNVLLANGTGGTGNNAGSTTTSITSTASGSLGGGTLQVLNNSTNGVALSVTQNNNSNTIGGLFVDNNGNGTAATIVSNLLGTGTGKALSIAAPTGVAQMNIGPDTGSTFPTFANGDVYANSSGLYYSPFLGTAARMSAALQLIAPERVYDSRPAQQPATGPKTPITNGSTVDVDVAGAIAGGGPNLVAAGAFSVLGNITVVSGSNPVFLTVFPTGTPPPATSNVNAGPNQAIANTFVSSLGGGSGNQISIRCGGGPADFIIDIFGWAI